MSAIDRVGAASWAIGNTKVFMKNACAADLEQQREVRIVKLMTRLQARVRGRHWRKQLRARFCFVVFVLCFSCFRC